MLSIVDCILDLLYFLENLLFVSGYGKLFCLERVTNTSYFRQHIGSRLHYYYEGCSRLDGLVRTDLLSSVIGDIESIENTVSFCCPKHHLSEFQNIFGRNNPRNVDQPELRKSGFREVNFLHFALSLFGGEYLTSFEKKVLVIFKINDLFL